MLIPKIHGLRMSDHLREAGLRGSRRNTDGEERVCLVCGTRFEKPQRACLPFRYASKTCSAPCGLRYQRALGHRSTKGISLDASLAEVALLELRRHPKLKVFNCAHCGAEFEDTAKRKKYCCQQCATDDTTKKYYTAEEKREARRQEKVRARARNLANGFNTNGNPWHIPAPKKLKPIKLRSKVDHCPHGSLGSIKRLNWNNSRNRRRRLERAAARKEKARGTGVVVKAKDRQAYLTWAASKIASPIQNGGGPTNTKPGQSVEVRL